MDTEKLADLLAYMRRKLEAAETHGAAVCEPFTAEEMFWIVAGLEEVTADRDSLGSVKLRFALRDEPALVPLGPEWPEAMRDSSNALSAAGRVVSVHYRDAANSRLAEFFVRAANAVREEPEVARLIGRRMR